MIFKASLDKFSFRISYVYIPIAALGIIANIYLILKKNPGSISVQTGVFFAMLFFILIEISSYLFRTSQYELKENAIYINRPIGNVIIPLSSVKDIYMVDEKDMKWTIRMFGSGGLFGYYGLFYNREQGRMTWYATQRRNYVMLITKRGKKIILTPDDLSLIDAVKNY